MNRRKFLGLCAGFVAGCYLSLDTKAVQEKPRLAFDLSELDRRGLGGMRNVTQRDILKRLYSMEPPYDVEELKKVSPPWHPRAYRMSDVGLHPRQLKSLG